MKVCNECNKEIKLRLIKGASWRTTCECPDINEFEPTTRATIVIPSRYPDIFGPCQKSIDKFAPKEKKILVRDGHSIESPQDWKTIQATETFCYARNVNLGMKEADGDVLLCNDDVLFTKPRTLETLQAILSRYPQIGIVSPHIDGKVGEYWQGHATDIVHYTDVRLCFVCVLIRKEVVEKVGLLDERFTGGYGYDDCDYCRRVVNAGYRLAVTGRTTVIHGHIDGDWSTSYRREPQTLNQLDKIAGQQYFDKWGDYSLECKPAQRLKASEEA